MTNTASIPTSTTTSASLEPVSVIGAGPMGQALTRAFLSSGAPTTVWNRTPERVDPLVDEGADAPGDLVRAVAASPVIVACLRDHATTREVLGDLPEASFRGRTVVLLASATPAEARETQRWAGHAGITLLQGAIMVPTPLIGRPGALVLYSGRRELLDQHLSLLQAVAPRSEHVGTDPGAAAVLDTAMLDVFFAGMTGFLHAAAMVTAQGIDARSFVPRAHEILALLPETVTGLGEAVDAGAHPGTEDNLAMELATLEHIVHTSAESGTDPRFPAVMRDIGAAAVERGHGAESWSRIIDVLRGPAPGAAA